MGLFSFLSKKQEAAGEDSGAYTPADAQSLTARARSKRASNAAGPRRGAAPADDPVLPEKKRARRRLVGAIALALAVAVGLPMVLDSEPKPLASDISIQIPSKDKPAAAEPASASAAASVAASAALDQSEEIVNVPPAAPKAAPAAEARPKPEAVDLPKADVRPAEPKGEPKTKAEPKAEAEVKPKAKAEPEVKHESKAEARHEAKAEAKPAEPKHEARHEAKAKSEDKPADDASRALAILEGKPAAKPAEAASSKFVVQVAALASQEKVDELQGKLRDAGIKSYTQKVPTPTGERIRVRVGPFGSKEEAEKARARLGKLGLNGSLVPA